MENQRRQNDVRAQQGGGEIFVKEHFLIDKHSGTLLSVWGWGNRRIVPNPSPDMLKLHDCIWHSEFGGGEFAKELYVQYDIYMFLKKFIYLLISIFWNTMLILK